MKYLDELLIKNSEKRVSVHIIGDAMIDNSYMGKISRISPDSPSISVFLTKTDKPTTSIPGGSACVCHMLKNFNVDAKLFSWVNSQALKIFEEAGLCLDGLMLNDYLSFPVKHRFFDGETQVGLRWDVEESDYSGQEWEDLRSNIRYLIHNSEKPDVILVSDYAKGALTESAIKSLKLPLVPIVVDPKKGPVNKWASLNCTIFKPNSIEAIELSDGETDKHKQCDYFQNKVNCESVVVTNQGKGVYGKIKDKYFEYIPKHYVSSHRTIGAGDAFISVLGVAIAHKMPVEAAAEVAFEAAARYVQQQKREPITLWQLQKQSKFASPEELKNRNYKLVISNGCWDVLHAGHLESLRFAKSKGDKLAVLVNDDQSIRRLKGNSRPVVPLQERMEMLAALECVDFVLSFEQDTPLELIKYIKPDVLIKGQEWQNKQVAGADCVEEIYFVPMIEDRSTTNIIEKIKNLT